MSLNPRMIDRAGDVLLQIYHDSTDRLTVLRVSSKVLCLASPVFNAMLGPDSPFQEALAIRDSTDIPATIPLLCDDVDALFILLQAAHLPGYLLPRRLPIDELYNLAIVCDKYDMARLMVPWSIIWMSCMTVSSDLRSLAIAWVFRDPARFNTVTSQHMINAKPDEGNQLVIDGSRIAVPLVPKSVIDAIGAERLQVIAKLSSLAHAELEKYTMAAADGRNLCQASSDSDPSMHVKIGKMRSACDRLVAGSLLLLLSRVAFYHRSKEMRAAPRRSFES